jgi:hypothetical protein
MGGDLSAIIRLACVGIDVTNGIRNVVTVGTKYNCTCRKCETCTQDSDVVTCCKSLECKEEVRGPGVLHVVCSHWECLNIRAECSLMQFVE